MIVNEKLPLVAEVCYLNIHSRVGKNAVCASGIGGTMKFAITFTGVRMKLLDTEYSFAATVGSCNYHILFHTSSGEISISDGRNEPSIIRSRIDFFGCDRCEDDSQNCKYALKKESIEDASAGKVVAAITLLPDHEPAPCPLAPASRTWRFTPQAPFDLRCTMIFAIRKLIDNMDVYWCGI